MLLVAFRVELIRRSHRAIAARLHFRANVQQCSVYQNVLGPRCHGRERPTPELNDARPGPWPSHCLGFTNVKCL